MLARYMLSSCVCRRPSVTSRYCIETTGRIELVFGMEASFHLSHPVLIKSGYLQKSGWVYPSGTLSKTPDLENFATASQSRCQQHSLSSSSTVEFVDDTYIDELWLFTTSLCRLTVTLRLHYFDCGFVAQLVFTVCKILTDIARRAVRLR